MAVKLPDEWPDLDDPLNLGDVDKLCDRLHRARVRPTVCDGKNRLCGGKQPSQAGNRKATHCQEFVGEQGNDLMFPIARCILDWRKETDDSLFTNVQCQLGLLQTVVLTAQISPGANRYYLEHLETSVGLQLPWIRPNPSSGQPELDKRREVMNGIFRDYREEQDVREFVDLLETGLGDEFIEGAGSIRFIDDLEIKRLSLEEKEQQVVLATDMEQSFFSLLFVLVAAYEHAEEYSKRNGRDRIDILAEWIDGGNLTLRSELCHTNRELDEDRPEEEFIEQSPEYRPNVKYGDRAFLKQRKPFEDSSGKHFWRASIFKDAAFALGFTKARKIKGREDPDTQRVTERFQRMIRWLANAANLYLSIENGPKLLKQRVPPALLTQVDSKGENVELIEILQLTDFFSGENQAEPSLFTLQALCRHLVDKLSNTAILNDSNHSGNLPEHFSELDDAETGKPGVRFYLPGEYFLRKGEDISRNFFAMPLSYTSDDLLSKARVGAFAVGTLLDFEEISETTKPRLYALRQLLLTLAQFGIGRVQAKFLSEYRRAEAARAFGHDVKQIAKALSNRWIVPPPDELRKLAEENIANPPAWLKTDWRIVPFPELIETSGQVIALWCFLEDPDDVFAKRPEDMNALIHACWKLAVDTLKPHAGRVYDLKVEGEIDNVRKMFDEFDSLWKGVFKVRIGDSVPKPNWTLGNADKWMRLSRLVINELMDCIRHSNPTKEVVVDISVDDNDLKIVIKDSQLPVEQEEMLPEWLKSSRQRISTVPFPGLDSGKEVQVWIADGLGGKIYKPEIKNGEYEFVFTLPLSRLLESQGGGQ